MSPTDKKIDLLYDVIDDLMTLNQHLAINLLMEYIFIVEEDVDIDLAILVITLPIKYNATIKTNRQKFLDRTAIFDKNLIRGLE